MIVTNIRDDHQRDGRGFRFTVVWKNTGHRNALPKAVSLHCEIVPATDPMPKCIYPTAKMASKVLVPGEEYSDSTESLPYATCKAIMDGKSVAYVFCKMEYMDILEKRIKIEEATEKFTYNRNGDRYYRFMCSHFEGRLFDHERVL